MYIILRDANKDTNETAAAWNAFSLDLYSTCPDASPPALTRPYLPTIPSHICYHSEVRESWRDIAPLSPSIRRNCNQLVTSDDCNTFFTYPLVQSLEKVVVYLLINKYIQHSRYGYVDFRCVYPLAVQVREVDGKYYKICLGEWIAQRALRSNVSGAGNLG